MMDRPHLAMPRMARRSALSAVATYGEGQERGAMVLVLEQETYRPGAPVSARAGWMARPRMASRPPALALESTDLLVASDLGYRNEAGGSYPPTLDRSLQIDRHVNLHPSSPAASVGWGTAALVNLGRRYDSMATTRNCDGRPVRLLVGRRRYDFDRGIHLDPPYSELRPLFSGVALPWSLSESALSIPLRDATALLERPLQQSLYTGTGGMQGTADLAGRRLPRARGGSLAQPILDVAPVWVDRAEGILQVSDAPGIVVRVSESGDPAQIVEVGQVASFGIPWPATVPVGGRWRWMSGPGGLFIQLESPTTALITADVVGFFPSGAHASTAAGIALRLLTEDAQIPAAMIDLDSILGLDAAFPWVAGDYWDGNDAVTADIAVGLFLASLGAKLVPARSGRLRAWALRHLPAGTRPAAAYTTAQLVSVTPTQRLAEAGLSPPPYRWRVGWGRCNTVQTTSLDPDITGERQAFLAAEFRLAPWFSAELAAAWRNPNDPPVVPTRLLSEADAATLAADLGAQWGAAPRVYDVVLPIEIGLKHEIGDPVVIAYPLDDLDGGRLGQIVGEQTALHEATMTLKVLI